MQIAKTLECPWMIDAMHSIEPHDKAAQIQKLADSLKAASAFKASSGRGN